MFGNSSIPECEGFIPSVQAMHELHTKVWPRLKNGGLLCHPTCQQTHLDLEIHRVQLNAFVMTNSLPQQTSPYDAFCIRIFFQSFMVKVETKAGEIAH